MKRRAGNGNHALPLLLTLLLVAGAPLAAQQAATPAPPAAVGATGTTPPARTATAGPRLNTDWRPARPAFQRDRLSPSGSDSHTITVSTIVLVLVVVVVLLLVLR